MMKVACFGLLFLVAAVGAQQTRLVRTYANPYLFRLQGGSFPQRRMIRNYDDDLLTSGVTRVSPGGLRRVVSLGDDDNTFSPLRRSALLVRRRSPVRRLGVGRRSLMTSLYDDDDNYSFLRPRRLTGFGTTIRRMAPRFDDDDLGDILGRRMRGSTRYLGPGVGLGRRVIPRTIGNRRSIFSPRRVLSDDNDDFDDLFRFNRRAPLTMDSRRRVLSPLRVSSLDDDYDDVLRPFSRNMRGRVSPMRRFGDDDDDFDSLRFNRPFSRTMGNMRSMVSPMRGFSDNFDDLDDGFNLNLPSRTMGGRRNISPMRIFNDNNDDLDDLWNPLRRSMSIGSSRNMASSMPLRSDDDMNNLFSSFGGSRTFGNMGSSLRFDNDDDDWLKSFSGTTSRMGTLGSTSVSSTTGSSLLDNDFDDNYNTLEPFKIF
ncbi:uncharacterized protein LOC133202431 [Saccostrea echinata]|uniref:uncharacterized protein LOC133202431 n=1 Tax=Saccostrea echinata TaxID=191078 RepID=UPI002A809530|nr:uncharacterized protein LOC133202431 [Saccostrea echinata]